MFRERFEREARTLSGLSHPNVCTVFDIGRDRDVDYLVMEYLDGRTLADVLERGPMPLADALRDRAPDRRRARSPRTASASSIAT